MTHNLREWVWNSNVGKEQSEFDMLCLEEVYTSRVLRHGLSQGRIILKRDKNTIKNTLYKHHKVSFQEEPEKLRKAFPSLGERWVSVKGNPEGRTA